MPDAHVGRLHAGRSDQHQRGPARPARLRPRGRRRCRPLEGQPVLWLAANSRRSGLGRGLLQGADLPGRRALGRSAGARVRRLRAPLLDGRRLLALHRLLAQEQQRPDGHHDPSPLRAAQPRAAAVWRAGAVGRLRHPVLLRQHAAGPDAGRLVRVALCRLGSRRRRQADRRQRAHPAHLRPGHGRARGPAHRQPGARAPGAVAGGRARSRTGWNATP